MVGCRFDQQSSEAFPIRFRQDKTDFAAFLLLFFRMLGMPQLRNGVFAVDRRLKFAIDGQFRGIEPQSVDENRKQDKHQTSHNFFPHKLFLIPIQPVGRCIIIAVRTEI